MWYVLEIEGTVRGSTNMGSAQVLGIGPTLHAAQHRAVLGFIDGMDGMDMDRAKDAIDFAYVVQVARSCDRTVIALQVQEGTCTLKPHNR